MATDVNQLVDVEHGLMSRRIFIERLRGGHEGKFLEANRIQLKDALCYKKVVKGLFEIIWERLHLSRWNLKQLPH